MPLRANKWQRPQRAAPVRSGLRNPERARPAGRSVVQSGNLQPPRPASVPNPAAAVLSGEERMASFADPHMVPASELAADPVFRFRAPVQNLQQLAQRPFAAETERPPKGFHMQTVGMATMVVRRASTIMTAEDNSANKLWRAL